MLRYWSEGLGREVVVPIEKPGVDWPAAAEAIEAVFGVFQQFGQAMMQALQPLGEAFAKVTAQLKPIVELMQPELDRLARREMWRRKKDPTRGPRKVVVLNHQLGRCSRWMA